MSKIFIILTMGVVMIAHNQDTLRISAQKKVNNVRICYVLSLCVNGMTAEKIADSSICNLNCKKLKHATI